MKIRTLIGLATTASLITACSNEVDFGNQFADGMLVATVEQGQPSTRVGFAENGDFYWSTGDQLGVTTSQNKTSFSALTLSAGSGTSKGSFQGTVTGEIEGYAVYPHNASHALNGATLTYNFPASYTYSKVDADYFTATQGEGNSFNPAMWGAINNGSVTVKHLGGVFCIKIDKMPAASGTLTLSADKKISGSYTVDLSGDAPLISAAETQTETEKKVSIEFSNATQGAPGVFYVPVPVGTYSNVRVALKTGETTKMDAAAGNYTIARKTLKKMEFTNVSLDVTPEKVQQASDVNNTLSSKDNVELTAEVSSSSSTEISIPAVTNASAGTEVSKSVSLSNVASGASIKVTDASTEGAKSVDNFTLSIPNNDAVEHQPLTVEISMPNTTVTLAGNAGAAKFGEVTAETADNTLVISGGVTVTKVIVKKGNIRVQKGAKVEAIEKHADNTASSINVYVEEGAEIPDKLDDRFNVVEAEIADMIAVLEKGGSYTLTKDMTGDFVVKGKATINLGGYKITNKAGDTFTVNLGASLTIDGQGTVDNITNGMAAIYNNGTVVLNGGTYTRSKENGQSNSDAGGNSYYNILNHGEMTINSGVTVSQSGKYSSMIANGYYSYNSSDPRSGYVGGTNAAAPKLIINGGTFDGGLNTVKNDDGADLEIKGGQFKNVSQSAVMNHNKAKIEGGSFECRDAEYVLINYGHNNESQDLADLAISGGTFMGKIQNENTGADLTVTGGEFNDLNAVSFASADSGQVKVKLDADVDLTKQIVSKGKEVTLNLNGHTIKNTNDIWKRDSEKQDWSLISVQGGKLTITGVGNVCAKTNDCYAVDVRNGDATLVVESGKFVGNIHAVYVLLGTAEIKGGEYSIEQVSPGEKPYGFVLNCYDENYQAGTAKISVTGGTFHIFNPASNVAEGASTNFCAEGYAATTSDNGETWVVSKTTSNE